MLGSVLEILESATNYRDWIFSLAEPYLGNRVLEIGAGSGTMFSCIADRECAIAVEVDDVLIKTLETRFGSRKNVTLVSGSVNESATLEKVRALHPDSAMTFNVLEHIENDVEALQSIAAVLDRGNTVTVLVPAFPSIFGAMDRAVGHVRRYRRRDLVAKMKTAGFSVSAAHYVNLPGYFAWFVNGRVLRASRPAGGPRLVSIYDRRIIPVTRALEGAKHPPFGQSLFVAGVKR
jgi:SAM-dependent methyltransferase